jgi:hypothetical protein
MKTKKPHRRGDRLWTIAIGGALSVAVCTPPYLLGRVGILMLGSKILLVPGIFLLAISIMLLVGAVGAVRAIKLSTKLIPTADVGGVHE